MLIYLVASKITKLKFCVNFALRRLVFFCIALFHLFFVLLRFAVFVIFLGFCFVSIFVLLCFDFLGLLHITFSQVLLSFDVFFLFCSFVYSLFCLD